VLTKATVNATAGSNATASTGVPIADRVAHTGSTSSSRPFPGGPASGFGNLNWFEFAGRNGRGYAVAPANGGGRPATAEVA
jgi:hypothetical protein